MKLFWRISMINKEMKYKLFFESIKKFKEEQQKQKQRGLNNYNILTTVLKPHDEVRLHSRMIASLLNINGEHFQDTLFLDKFLDIVHIKDYNCQNSKIYIEYENIDLYLTDGVKHIIIENKIWADDQTKQIERYVDIIKSENENIKEEDLYVIYLSLNRNQPSNVSLGNLIIDNCFLIKFGEKIAKYKNINYNPDILKWLYKCQYEIQNITNLNEAIKQYIDVINMLNNNYRGKIKTMKDEILLKGDNLELAIKEVLPAITESKIDIQIKFWNILKEKLSKLGYDFAFVDGNFNFIDIRQKCKDYYENSKNNKYYGLKYDLEDAGSKYGLAFYIEIDWNIYYGFTLKDGSKRKPIVQENQFKDLSEKILRMNIKWSSTNKDSSQQWWICWKYANKKLDFKSFNSDNIFQLVNEITSTKEGENSLIDTIAEEIDTMLKKYNQEIK